MIYIVKIMLHEKLGTGFAQNLAVMARYIMDPCCLAPTWMKMSSFKFIEQKIRTNLTLSESLSP